MNISKEILDRIETDMEFRMKLAIELSVSERQVKYLVQSHRRGKSVRFRDVLAVNFFIKEGYTKGQIFESIKATT